MFSTQSWRGFRALWAVGVMFLLPALALAQSVVTSPSQDGARTEAYWTPERKAAARPMPLPSVSGVPTPAPVAMVQAAARTPMKIAGTLPDGVEPDSGPSAGLSEVAPAFGPGSTVWYDYPAVPYTLFRPILGYNYLPQFPYKTLGKLYFSRGGGNYVCSAQSVTSNGSWGPGNRQTVVTAGHCCSDGGGTWASNWRFEPLHFNGNAPLGSWNAQYATVYTAWHTGGDFSVDYCVLQMRTNGGQNIHNATGALGYAWNFPLPQHYVETGWPAAAPYSGGLLYMNAASDAETDTAQAGLVPYTHGTGNPMTGGSSGGAWIKDFQPIIARSNNYFNGLNSYKYINPNRPNEMFGPYITDLFVDLLQVRATAPPAP